MGKDNGYKVSTAEETQDFLTAHQEWQLEENHLKSSFKLADFATAVAVMNETFKVAASMNHHPRLTNTYDQLAFSLCTHSAGDKVTSYDIAMAQEIDLIVAKWQ